MARVDNLTNFLTDVAAAIKTKGGTSDTISPQDFDTLINNLPSGGAAGTVNPPSGYSILGYRGPGATTKTEVVDNNEPLVAVAYASSPNTLTSNEVIACVLVNWTAFLKKSNDLQTLILDAFSIMGENTVSPDWTPTGYSSTAGSYTTWTMVKKSSGTPYWNQVASDYASSSPGTLCLDIASHALKAYSFANGNRFANQLYNVIVYRA